MTALNDVMQTIVEKADGDTDKVEALLTAAVLKDRALLAELVAAYVHRVVPRKQPRSRRREGPHRRVRPKVPSESQKAANRSASAARIDAIFERKLRGGRQLGDVQMHELREFARAAANTATSFLTRGYDDAVEAIALVMLASHATASDPFAKVRDVIKPSVATDIFEKAKVRAAQEIRDASARVANDLVRLQLSGPEREQRHE